MSSYEDNTLSMHHEDSRLCALVEDLLPLYLEGEVNPSSRDLIVQHLSECRHCAGFLAGAQSARAQLRSERQQRQSVLAQDQPARHVLSITQRLLNGVGLLGGYGLILVAWLMLKEQMPHFDQPVPLLIGISEVLLLGLTGLGLIALSMRSAGPLSLQRMLWLVPFILIGGLGSAMIERSPVGLLAWAIGLLGIWLVSRQSAAPVVGAAGDAFSTVGSALRQPWLRQLGGLALLGAGALGLLIATGSLRRLFDPAVAVLLVVLGLLLWQHRPQPDE